MGISNNWTELWTVTVTLEWNLEWIMDYLSHIVSTNLLYRAFVCACIAKRQEHCIRVTMPGGMYGQGRKEVEKSRPQLTMPLDLEQPDPGE